MTTLSVDFFMNPIFIIIIALIFNTFLASCSQSTTPGGSIPPPNPSAVSGVEAQAQQFISNLVPEGSALSSYTFTPLQNGGWRVTYTVAPGQSSSIPRNVVVDYDPPKSLAKPKGHASY